MAGTFEFSASLEGLSGVQAYLDRAAAAVSPPLLTESVGKGAVVMAEHLKSEIAVGKSDDLDSRGHSHPGQLRDSVNARMLTPTMFEVGPDMSVGNVKDYAHMEQAGGTIVPVSAGHLRFTWQGVYIPAALRVTHKGQDYMGKGLTAGEAAAELAIRKAIALAMPKA